jgi:hypothetical protein
VLCSKHWIKSLYVSFQSEIYLINNNVMCKHSYMRSQQMKIKLHFINFIHSYTGRMENNA